MSKNKNKNLTQIKIRNFYKNNKFGIYFFGFILLLIVLTLFISNNKTKEIVSNKIYGDDVIEMYYFHLRTCPHCIEQNKFMDDVLFKKYPNIRIHKYEMTKKKSYQKYQEMAKNYIGLNPNNFPGTPLTIIGDKVNIGFGTEKTTGPKIIAMVEIEQQKIDANWNLSMKRTVDLN